jgi:lipoprotein-anchoring transpeptidase ErfK/SrfK
MMQAREQEIVVSVADQRLDLLENGRPLASFPVSTSAWGLGTEPGSNKTPTGRFRVAEMIGADAPPGAVFRSRLATGETGEEANPEDLVQTRILWLEGVEPENANTKERYVYIHGTNHEREIGQPVSHGCIRMRNRDVIALFESVGPGTTVRIVG